MSSLTDRARRTSSTVTRRAACAVALSAYAMHATLEPHAREQLIIAATFAFGHGIALAALARHGAHWLGAVSLLAMLGGVLLFAGSLVGVVAAESDGARIVLSQVVERHQVVDAVEHHAHGAGRVGAVAAALGLRSRLQHRHRGARLAGRQGRTGCRITGAHHQHIDLKIVHASLLT